MVALQSHLPMACSQENFWLKYSLLRDGTSIVALESKIAMTRNTLVAVETVEGDVFGCFMAKASLEDLAMELLYYETNVLLLHYLA
jgi:hypothetical protein